MNGSRYFLPFLKILAKSLKFSRIGFENYGNVIVKSVLITVCVIMAPTLLKLKYSINESNNQWYLSKIIFLLVLFCFCLSCNVRLLCFAIIAFCVFCQNFRTKGIFKSTKLFRIVMNFGSDKRFLKPIVSSFT